MGKIIGDMKPRLILIHLWCGWVHFPFARKSQPAAKCLDYKAQRELYGTRQVQTFFQLIYMSYCHLSLTWPSSLKFEERKSSDCLWTDNNRQNYMVEFQTGFQRTLHLTGANSIQRGSILLPRILDAFDLLDLWKRERGRERERERERNHTLHV